jgi:thiamine-phosphate diphosphorylase
MRLPRLHLVTSDDVLAAPGFADAAEAVLEACGSGAALHLRGHATPGSRLHTLGERLAAAALRSGSWLLVNDRVDVAMAVRANGVQLGASSLPVADARALLGAGARIGYSAHSALEVLQAETDGADFALVGTIYASASHPGREPAGVALLAECTERGRLPVIAIGGMTPERVGETAAAGAWGVAVLGGVWSAALPDVAAARYLDAVRSEFADTAGEEQVLT